MVIGSLSWKIHFEEPMCGKTQIIMISYWQSDISSDRKLESTITWLQTINHNTGKDDRKLNAYMRKVAYYLAVWKRDNWERVININHLSFFLCGGILDRLYTSMRITMNKYELPNNEVVVYFVMEACR